MERPSLTPNIPAKYASTHTALQRAISKPPTLTSSDIAHTLENLATYMNSGKSQVDLKAGVKDLNDRAVAIDRSLTTTENLLIALLDEKFDSGFKRELESVVELFLVSHEARIYRRFLGYPSAGIECHIEFVDNVVPMLSNPALSKADKLARVQKFKESLDKSVGPADELRQRVEKLTSGLQGVVARWQQAVDKYHMDVVVARIQDYDTKLKSLDVTIGDLATKIAKLAVALDVTSTFSAVVKNVGEFIPEWTDDNVLFDVVNLGVSRTTLGDVKNELDEIYTGFDTQEAERDDAVTKLGSKIKQAHASLVGDNRTANHALWQFKAVTRVWSSISTDLQASADRLGKEDEHLLKARLETMSELYKSLILALKEYDRLFTVSVRPTVRSWNR
ncbi:hypothetical protein EIP91_008808 [Steccherinum ochraceum]|uniref:Uncharacterized protein n=1 Tax=Steccherinum ochraceum TaxID=92696 RepID=A0A4R0R507_9APHY|nr:hypothetical protein EIP91_008808 [Steccherinum ochraceum]